VRVRADGRQIVTKTFELFDRHSFAVDICVCAAHCDADAGVPQEFVQNHSVKATVHETSIESAAQRVPRHIHASRLSTC
jgi:hypothetical protein